MSQAGVFVTGGPFPPGSVVETLEGNTGGPVGPDGLNNINVVGDGIGITVAGSPGTNTLTISLVGGGGTTDQFDTDFGTAIPAAGIINIIADNAAIQAGSSVFFSGSGNTVLLNVTDSNNNTIIGEDSGNLTISGFSNTILGQQSGPMLASGSSNTIIGSSSASLLDSGQSNIIVGSACAVSLNSGESNVIIGTQSASSLDSGDENVIIGNNGAISLNSGSDNVLIGFSVAGSLDGGTNNVIIGRSAASSMAGSRYNVIIGDNTGDGYDGSDSSNICIGYNIPGSSGEQHTLRIAKATGSGDGELNKSFIHGIRGITPDNPDGLPVIIDSAGQLGTGGGGIFANSFPTDSGTAVPVAGVLNIIANTAAQHAGSSVSFSGSGNTVLLNVTDAVFNTIVGQGSGNATLTGNDNTIFGATSGFSLTSGSENTIVGLGSGSFITTGSRNVIIGSSSVEDYTSSESDNIIIGYNVDGDVLDSHTLKIGSGTGVGGGALTRAFICGIDGVNVGSTATVVTENADQLGTAVITAGTGITITPGANLITISTSGISTLSYTAVSTTPYVVLAADDFISVDSSGGVRTIQLPNAATLGKTYVVKDRTGSAGTNAITVTTVGGAVNIDGATTFVMNTNYQAISIIGNGTTYEIY